MRHLISKLFAMANRATRIAEVIERDDLVQEAAVRLQLQSRGDDAYIGATLRNLRVDAYRRQRARGGANSIRLEDAYDAPALAYAADQESALLLKQIILALPPLYRDVFILNRFMGLTYPEIARKYGLSVKAVEYRMSRALALCEAALRD